MFFLFYGFLPKRNHKKTNPTFLIGDWMRLNDKEGNKTYENRNKDLTSLSLTFKGKNTTFKEIMSVTKVNDVLFLKTEISSSNFIIYFLKKIRANY